MAKGNISTRDQPEISWEQVSKVTNLNCFFFWGGGANLVVLKNPPLFWTLKLSFLKLSPMFDINLKTGKC